VATRDYPVLAQTAAANGANLIITAAGLPLSLPEYTAAYPNVALVPMVCGLEAVQTLCQTWQQRYGRLPDGFVVENSQAVGGHVGTTCDSFDSRIESLLPQIRHYLQHHWGTDVPLIAAGGIWDRLDVERMWAIAADGVQVGTRFITTEECDADRRFKECHLHASPADVVIVPSPVGKPARALRNAFAGKAIAAAPELERRCLANCLESCLCRDTRKTYCILQALATAARGDVENGLLFSGANIGRATQITSVAEVMAELMGLQTAVV
jgi:NAD(P)H-dependent flavin oxidoreductase YrpB (nitropropane dioxygenase family)